MNDDPEDDAEDSESEDESAVQPAEYQDEFERGRSDYFDCANYRHNIVEVLFCTNHYKPPTEYRLKSAYDDGWNDAKAGS